MSTREVPTRFSWRDASPMLVLVVGLALIALSVVWPTVSTGRSGWTEEKAVAYQAASAKVHQFSLQVGGTAPEHQTRALQEELANAQMEYGELREELDAARSRPARIVAVLRYSGVLLAVVGVVGLAMLQGRQGE